MTDPLRCVLDASVSIKQFIPDPLTEKVNQLLDSLAHPQTEIFVPDLFYIESSNALLKYFNKGLYTKTQVKKDLSNLKDLPLRVISTAKLMEEAVEIACNDKISAYDAAYVALSVKVQAPLLTLDRKLVNALSSASYDVQFFTNFSLSS